MMNRSNSAEDYVPSMMSFAEPEGSSQKHHLWDWETSSHSLNATVPATNNTLTSLLSQPFFPLDCPPPPLFPMNNFPFYSPLPVPEYPVGLIKQEDGLGGGGGRIGLNLGQRTYFSSGDGLDMERFFARSRGVYSLSHQQQLPRCQAEGCKADLSGAKHYHRRHKVCEFHSKATVVIAHGLQQRFCQQCSRFHVLAEFDEAKRSCRKRLADHNRRRRKPQLPTTPTTTGTPESSSSSMIATASSTEKSNQAQESTQDITTTKTTTPVCVTSICTKGNHARNGPALSLGGVGAGERRGSMVCNTMYQGQGVFGGINVGGQGLTSSSSAAAAANLLPFRIQQHLASSTTTTP